MNFTLLEAEDYYKTLLKEIPRAKKRVVLAAMIVLWGERTAPLFAMLEDAVKRGVKVTILLDNYTRLPYLYGIKPHSARKERVKKTLRALEDLARAGVKVYTFGKLGFPPYKGRCHVKVTVIDNQSFSFGGINLIDHMFGLTDFMLHSTNSATADCLAELVERIGSSHPPLHDGEVELAANTHVLFDGGRPGHSLIYERACELAAQATHIYYVSLMTPSGQLARLLHETDSKIYSNRAEQMLPIDGLGQAYDLQKYQIDNLYTGKPFLHAKYILFELPGARKALLSGSHNFSYRGVSFGTQEVALYSTDTKLWRTLHTHLEKYVAMKRVK